MSKNTDEDLKSAAIRLGGLGLGRAEIAVELGVPLAVLEQRAAASEELAGALALAEEVAMAWWSRLAREALNAGARFNQATWRAAAETRFGGAGEALADAAISPPSRQTRRSIVLMPLNGRERTSPVMDWDFDDEAALDRELSGAYERYVAEVEAIISARKR